MKNSICTVIQFLFLISMVTGWVCIHFPGSDFIVMGVCFVGFMAVQLIKILI